MWQKIYVPGQSCHWWQKEKGSKLAAMTTYLTVAMLLALLVAVAWLMQLSHRRAQQLPHLPPGADPRRELDLLRVLHDLDVRPRHC